MIYFTTGAVNLASNRLIRYIIWGSAKLHFANLLTSAIITVASILFIAITLVHSICLC